MQGPNVNEGRLVPSWRCFANASSAKSLKHGPAINARLERFCTSLKVAFDKETYVDVKAVSIFSAEHMLTP